MSLDPKLHDLLCQLSDNEWCSIGYRLGDHHPWEGEALVRLGLAERRPRAKKPGAFEYRRTEAGRVLCER
jgi:hypothetical protein